MLRYHVLSVWSQAAFLVCFSMTVGAFSPKEEHDAPSLDDFSKLVAWLKAHGGRVDDARIAVKELDGGVRGGVALADIKEGEELLFSPWELVIGSNGINDQMKDMCHVVRLLEHEFRLGEASLWHPYLELDDSLVKSRLPTLWDASALQELQGLPPQQDATRHVQWFSQDCQKNGSSMLFDKVTLQALISFITRASAVGMIPIYDLFNHHNGMRNAKIVVQESGVQLVAVRDILAGQQIYLSYGIKSASTMYRDYGFVEAWPQIWTWVDEGSSDRFSFVLLPDDNVVINPTQEFFQSIWSTSKSLREFQRDAMLHTQSVVTPAELQRFATAALKLLSNDGLPTSIDEDRVLLLEQKASLLLKANDDDESRGIKDIISAIEYRITFKQAVQVALSVSQQALIVDDASNSQEL